MKNGLDMIYLASCGLHGQTPDPKLVEGMDLAAIFQIAGRHSMSAITYHALERLLAEHSGFHSVTDKELLSKWKQTKDAAIYRSLLYRAERAKLLRFFEEKQIWYMPLKGVILQEYYAFPGLRQMSDNDILFDPAAREALQEYMAQNGYRKKSYGHHDVYRKAPFFDFEMHISLYDSLDQPEVLQEYYRQVKDRLLKDEGNGWGYHFTKEDFYIYCITHSFKHFISSGIGIRSLMDIYVYTSKEKNDLDRDYIEKELTVLSAKEFEEASRRLAYKLFSAENGLVSGNLDIFTEAETELLQYYLNSGTTGTRNNLLINQMNLLSKEKKVSWTAKVKYCLARICPPMSYYKVAHPILYRYKILIPFFLLYRTLHAIFRKHTSIRKELLLLFRFSK